MDKETRKKFTEHDKILESINKRFDRIEKSLSCCVTKTEFEDFRDYVEENMFTKKDAMNLMEIMEKGLEEIQEARVEREAFWHNFNLMDDKVANHEKRLRILERK